MEQIPVSVVLQVGLPLLAVAVAWGNLRGEVRANGRTLERVLERLDDSDDSQSDIHKRINDLDRLTGEHAGMFRFLENLLATPFRNAVRSLQADSLS